MLFSCLQREECELVSAVKSLCSSRIYKEDAERKLSSAIGANRNPAVLALTGTKTTDNVCEACPPGTSSSASTPYNCTSWPK